MCLWAALFDVCVCVYGCGSTSGTIGRLVFLSGAGHVSYYSMCIVTLHDCIPGHVVAGVCAYLHIPIYVYACVIHTRTCQSLNVCICTDLLARVRVWPG